MRLDKYLSNHSGLSRKEAKQALKSGDVIVNDQMINDPKFNVSDQDEVRWNGMAIIPAGPRYFMLNKPQGYVCANSDSQHPTVISLLFEDDPDTLQVAGRLDIDTTGLVLITDDGQWNHRITAPKHKQPKHYQAQLDCPIENDCIEIFAQGLLLKNELKRTRPAKLIIQSDTHVELIIEEGKYHQVKRMFAAVGNHVNTLHRFRIGAIELDNTLQPGEYRPLTQQEIQSIL